MNACCGWKDKLRTILRYIRYDVKDNAIRCLGVSFLFAHRVRDRANNMANGIAYEPQSYRNYSIHISHFCARMRQMVCASVHKRGSKCVKKIDTDATRAANNQKRKHNHFK